MLRRVIATDAYDEPPDRAPVATLHMAGRPARSLGEARAAHGTSTQAMADLWEPAAGYDDAVATG